MTGTMNRSEDMKRRRNPDLPMDSMNYYIGTSGWTYPHWFGLFYPEDWPKSKWFEYYARHFSSVEINATFYRTFKNQTYERWYEKAPSNFVYVLKAPRLITHRKYLLNVEADVQAFWRSARLLKEKLGLILLQLAPGTPYDPERLRKALLAFDEPSKVAVEFRHQRWMKEETRALLTELGVVFCSAESPQSKLQDWLTSESGYLRLHGRGQWYAYNYSDDELQEIAILARRLKAQGAKQIFIFFNNDFEGYAVQNAAVLKRILQE